MTEAKAHSINVHKAGREFSRKYSKSKRRGHEAKKLIARDVAKKYGINLKYFEKLMVSRDSNLC